MLLELGKEFLNSKVGFTRLALYVSFQGKQGTVVAV